METARKIDFDDLKPEVQQIIAGLAATGEGGVEPDEHLKMLSQIYYFLKDETTEKIMLTDPRLKPLIPGVSPLIRTSRQDNAKIRAQAKLRWKRAVEMQLLVMPEHVSLSDLALADAMTTFGFAAIDDQDQGWRGKLSAEKVRTYKMEGSVERKKGWLERLGLR